MVLNEAPAQRPDEKPIEIFEQTAERLLEPAVILPVQETSVILPAIDASLPPPRGESAKPGGTLFGIIDATW